MTLCCDVADVRSLGDPFDPFSLWLDGLAAFGVNVGAGQIVEALVMSETILADDEVPASF